MKKNGPIQLVSSIRVNELLITHVIIGQHYRLKHADYMTDDLIVALILSLDGKHFDADSTSNGIEYYAADIETSAFSSKTKLYRLIWLFEGEHLEVIGVINAYRTKKTKNKRK